MWVRLCRKQHEERLSCSACVKLDGLLTCQNFLGILAWLQLGHIRQLLPWDVRGNVDYLADKSICCSLGHRTSTLLLCQHHLLTSTSRPLKCNSLCEAPQLLIHSGRTCLSILRCTTSCISVWLLQIHKILSQASQKMGFCSAFSLIHFHFMLKVFCSWQTNMGISKWKREVLKRVKVSRCDDSH